MIVVLASCASNKPPPPPQGYLATHIFEDGRKQFVYTADMPNAPRGSPGAGRPGNVSGQLVGSNQGVSGGVIAGTTVNRGPGGHPPVYRQSKDDILVSTLEKELEKTGFCRDGYKELDRMTEPGQTYLKGECLDAANANDRTRFPNA